MRRSQLAQLCGLLFGIALLTGLGIVVIRSAWVTEDAYIMFRTIDNIWHGYGLTWNVSERVQVYTCPLWMFVLVPAIGLTGEFFFTSIAVCFAVTILMAGIFVWRLAPSQTAALLGVAALASSKAFIDYSTSALENPLTHLVLAVYCVFFFRVAEAPSVRGLFSLSLIAALGMLNRLDTALLFLPSLACIYWQVPKLRGFGAAALGMTPVLAWEIFSVIYYGFLFPNTAYAKLNLGITALEMMQQGLCFYANSILCDPVTLTVIGTGVVTACLGRRWREISIALGIVLYLLYIIKIGGDYMSGRFFTGPLLLAVVLVCRAPRAQKPAWALPALVVVLGLSLMMQRSPLRSGRDFGAPWDVYGDARMALEVDRWGIADERGFYYARLGLLPALQSRRVLGTSLPADIERSRADQRNRKAEPLLSNTIGNKIFCMAAEVHVIDRCALGDALLARLPMQSGPWRVGHYRRRVPAGYRATVQAGQNLFADPNLGAYYDKLKLVISAELWSPARWQAIWELNTGQLNHLIDVEHYRHTNQSPSRRE
jgi:arabinofuranosyltransferase